MTMLKKVAASTPSVLSSLGTDRRLVRVQALLLLFSALYFTLTPFNSVDCWWHMRGAEYFWQHGVALLNDPIAISGDCPILALYPNLLPGTLFWLAFSTGSFLGLNLLRVTVFMAFLTLLTGLIYRRRVNPLPLFSAVALLVVAMAGMVVLRPDLFNYMFLVLWLILLEQIRRQPTRAELLAALIGVEVLWVNSHPLFFYYGLGLGLFSVLFIPHWGKIRLPWPRSREVSVSSRRLYLIVIGLCWLVNPLGWRALLGMPVNMIRVNYVAGSMRSLLAALVSINTHIFFLIAILLLVARPWRRLPALSDRIWFFGSFLLVLLPALLYQRALPFLPIFLIVASALAPEAPPASRRPGRRLWGQVLLACLCIFLMLERLYLFSPRWLGWISRTGQVNLAEEFMPAGIGIASILSDERIREVEILKGLGCRGNFASNHLGICSAVTWLARGMTPYWYGHAALINARSADLRSFLIALENRDSRIVERFLDLYRIEVIALTNYTDRFLADPQRFLDHLTPVYIDPYLTVWVRRGHLRAEVRPALAHFYRTFFPAERDRQIFNPSQQMEQLKLLWLSAALTDQDGDRFLLCKTVSLEEWQSFRRQVNPLIAAVRAQKNRPNSR
ncbi:MAG: hypothetical protein L6428_04385 [Candidatus Aminicenantes bacterium]|nr:hypothetical protein [Candidatus Aminicenantes bacterium]